MARNTMRVCRVHGCPEIQAASLCREHAGERDTHQRRTTPTKVTRDWPERKRRAQAVADHIVEYGYQCPGIGRPPHAATDLTANHLTPIARGGDPRGPLGVACRSCNSRQADRF